MEWVNGKDLSNIKFLFEKRETQEKIKEILRMFWMLLRELQKMHESEFLHRDLKPDNLMYYQREGETYYMLIDFGSSFNINDDIETRIATRSPPYSAPEQNTNEECFASDVYAMGVCFDKIVNVLSISKMIPSELLEMINKMKQNQIKDRISISDCQQIVNSFFDQYEISIESLTEQPKLGDIQPLRTQINKILNSKELSKTIQQVEYLQNLKLIVSRINLALILLRLKSYYKNNKEKISTEKERIEFHKMLKNISNLKKSENSKKNSTDSKNRRSIHYYALSKNVKAAEQFLSNNKDQINWKDKNGNTSLHLACSVDYNLDIVKLLINNKADPNLRNEMLQTPLHFLAKNKENHSCVQFLLENGALTNIKDSNGMTPIEIAKFLQNEKIEQLFLSHSK